MCFTPEVSVGVAVVEFSITVYLWKRIKDKRLALLPIFILLLGLYQLTEFMLCKTSNAEIWARIGFATYTFMPMILLHLFLNLSDKKINKLFYLIPSIFTAIALFYPNFIIYSSCNFLHISVKSLIFNQNNYLMFVYLFYYASFPIYGLYMFIRKTKNKLDTNLGLRLGMSLIPLAILSAQTFFIFSAIKKIDPDLVWILMSLFLVVLSLIIIVLGSIPLLRNKNIFYWVILFVLITCSVTVFTLYALFPQFSYNFSSIFCQFALFYSIVAIILVEAWQSQQNRF